MKRNDKGYYTRINGKSGYVKNGWFTPDDGTRGGSVRRNFGHYARETMHEDELMQADTDAFVGRITAPLWKLLWFTIKVLFFGAIIMFLIEML